MLSQGWVKNLLNINFKKKSTHKLNLYMINPIHFYLLNRKQKNKKTSPSTRICPSLIPAHPAMPTTPPFFFHLLVRGHRILWREATAHQSSDMAPYPWSSTRRCIHLYMYIYMYVCVCVCVCVYTYIHTYTHIYTYMHICTYINIYVHIYIYMYISYTYI